MCDVELLCDFQIVAILLASLVDDHVAVRKVSDVRRVKEVRSDVWRWTVVVENKCLLVVGFVVRGRHNINNFLRMYSYIERPIV